MGVSESLNVIEDQPGKGDNHEDDEGDGDEENGGFADAVVWVHVSVLLFARGNGHHYTHALVSKPGQLLPRFLGHEDGHLVFHCNRERDPQTCEPGKYLAV